MAELPPRKYVTLSKMVKQGPMTSPLQTLMQMGFSKTRAEKALASTGNRNVQIASDWLLAHVNDPMIDEIKYREYILYVCPTGSFLKQLEEFWSKSREICGWNGAHNFVPHVTLVSFFKAPDEYCPFLTKTLKQTVELFGTVVEKPLKLELYKSQNFIGFFVGENDAALLKKVAMQYVKEISNSIISDTYEQLDAIVACFPWCGVSASQQCIPHNMQAVALEPQDKSLHLTLAYQFNENQYNSLKELAEEIDTSCASEWELRLYSRDPRLGTKQVHNVLFPHIPRENDELELRIGDYIYLNCEAQQTSLDGWVEGISWLTGMIGFLPENHTKRTAESDAWTLHQIINLNKYKHIPTLKEIHINDRLTISQETSSDSDHIHTVKADVTSQVNVTHEEDSISSSECKNSNSSSSDESRKFYIMRHGERIDFTFGTWIPYCFDEFNNYVRKDLNMPKYLIERKDCIESWQNDSPLTNIGLFQAQSTGEALKDANIKIDSAYSSPSYRCLQTCNNVLEGLNLKDQIPIKIEPGLFEWMAWYPNGVPTWCSTEELTAANYNIDALYTPFYPNLQTASKESSEEFYTRNFEVLRDILQKTTGNVLIVGHAATLDTCTRQLVGKNPRNANELKKVIHKIPYCSLIAVENKNNEWILTESPCLPMTHSKNARFEWNILST